MGPSTIVTGTATPDYNAMRVELGTYVQVFEDNDPSNTPRGRSLGAIALCPTGNAQGNYYFMSLATGSRISGHNWTVLPVPDTAIARVKALAMHEGRPLIQERGLVIEWRPDHPIHDTEYDRDYAPPNVGPLDVFDAADYDPIEPDELDALGAPHDDPDLFPDPAQGAAAGADDDVVPGDSDEDTFDGEDDDPPDEDDDQHEYVTNDDYVEEAQARGGVDRQVIADHQEQGAAQQAQEGAGEHDAQGADGYEATQPVFADGYEATQTAHYNLRPRAPAHQGFKDAMDMPHDGKSYYPPMQLLQQVLRQASQTTSGINKNHCPPTQILQHALRHASRTALETKKRFVFEFILAQMATTCTLMSERAGLRKHGKAAEAALMTEFSQLENLDVYEPLDPTKLARKQKRAAIRALNMFKEKRDGTLKGRTCADGRSQRNLYVKSQTASLTVSTDALLLSIIIDAYEARDVGTADVVGAYLNALMDDFVIMKFVGPSVRMLCKLNPDHERFVTVENGVEVLYVRLIKALYGCVKSALLWYELFVGNLKDMGFELNPYDSCVANCMIEGKQCTVAWYVDDTKISHVNPDVVTRVILELEKRFDKMTVTRGREHTFLGMRIRYTDENTAVITMKDYLEEAITESGLDISRPASTPANRTIFEVDDTSEPLSREESEAFHSVSAKLLYVSLRAQVDLLLAIAFLCTRVSKSTKQDQSKLKRVLQYIKGTMDLEYTVGADDMGKIRTWVDASYAVHPDMRRSHTGGTMSFGCGGILCKSSKQKLNTKSSTEAEFVGASDYLPNTIWVKNFLEAQGYKIEENVFKQDNESAIRLERNGRTSARPKSRHINVRYFWMKDRVKSEGIKVRHCPTLQMVGDFFTKPLQGALFRKFRDVIMGDKHMNTLAIERPMLAEERVGSTGQPDDGTSECTSKQTSNDATMTVVEATSWADIVRGASSATGS
jgi:hypothetical protein